MVLIEPDEQRVAELSDAYVGPVIHGDATRPSILTQADLDDADAIAALTDDTSANLAICMEAQHLNPAIQTLARADTQRNEEYEEVVDATLLPKYLGGDYAADMLTGEDVRTLVYPTSDLDIIEISVAESAPVAGRRLDEIALPEEPPDLDRRPRAPGWPGDGLGTRAPIRARRRSGRGGRGQGSHAGVTPLWVSHD